MDDYVHNKSNHGDQNYDDDVVVVGGGGDCIVVVAKRYLLLLLLLGVVISLMTQLQCSEGQILCTAQS